MTAYSDLIIASNPNGYWRLGERSGTTANSEVNNSTMSGSIVNTPTLGTPSLLTTEKDTSMLFKAASLEYIYSVTHKALQDVGDVFTVEAWIKRASINNLQNTIFDNGANSLDLRITSDNYLNLSKYGVADIVSSTIQILDFNIHHVAATKNGSNVHLYIDGVDVTGTVTNATIINSSGNWQIASDANANLHFDGWIDEVAFYPTALSSNDILSRYRLGSSISNRGYYFTNSAEGGSNLTNVTTGNSGGASGRAWDSIVLGGNGAALTFDSTRAFRGSLSYLSKNGTTQGNQTQLFWSQSFTNLLETWQRGIYYLETAVPAGGYYYNVMGLAQAGVGGIGCAINAPGTGNFWSVYDRDLQHGIGTIDPPIGKWIRFEAHSIAHPTTGFMEAWLYLDPFAPINKYDDYVSIPTAHTGDFFDQIGYGPDGNQAPTGTQANSNFDDLGVSTFGQMGPSTYRDLGWMAQEKDGRGIMMQDRMKFMNVE